MIRFCFDFLDTESVFDRIRVMETQMRQMRRMNTDLITF